MTIAQVEAAPTDLFGHFTVNDNGVLRTYTNKTLLLQDLCDYYYEQYGQRIYIEGVPQRGQQQHPQSTELLFEEDEEPERKPGVHRRKAVIAIKDGKEMPFKSSAEAARELKIDRTNIPHALSGKYRHVNGYQFKYA